jgi:iron(III) transport system substrate-binding protein
VVLRTAVIPRTGPHPEEARRFLDYLLSPRGQRVLSREARLMPIVTGNARGERAGRSRRPIQGPACWCIWTRSSAASSSMPGAAA